MVGMRVPGVAWRTGCEWFVFLSARNFRAEFFNVVDAEDGYFEIVFSTGATHPFSCQLSVVSCQLSVVSKEMFGEPDILFADC